jgi:hypothetical protein
LDPDEIIMSLNFFLTELRVLELLFVGTGIAIRDADPLRRYDIPLELEDRYRVWLNNESQREGS